jgi:hypothetical protein
MSEQPGIFNRTNRVAWPRLIMLAVIIVLSWWSASFAFTQVTRVGDPAKALMLNAKEPVALAAQADQFLVKSMQDKSLHTKVARWATLSLTSQALNPRALRIWGFMRLGEQSNSTTRKAMMIALRASRQEAGAHLWLIEDYVVQEDVLGTLKHYDLALRTSSISRTTLLPLLVNALDDERILAGLVPYVKRHPVWLYSFFEAAIRDSKNPQNVAALIMRSGGLPDGQHFLALQNALLSQLIAAEQFAAAKSYFLSLKGADAKLLISPSLFSDNVSDRFPPMAWQPRNVSASGMRIIKGTTQEAALLVYAGSGERGLVAQKKLFLERGEYAIGVRFGASQMPTGGSVKLTVSCAGGASPKILWQSDLLRPQRNALSYTKFAVPESCLAQNIEIEMVGGQEQLGAEIEILSIKLGIA